MISVGLNHPIKTPLEEAAAASGGGAKAGDAGYLDDPADYPLVSGSRQQLDRLFEDAAQKR